MRLSEEIMKLNHILSIALLAISCPAQCQDKYNNLKGFNDFLGPDKADVLNSAVQSFDRFLLINFSLDASTSTIEFLKYIQDNSAPDSSWALPTERNKTIVSEFESSGLRKEIWIYGDEEFEAQYDIHEILLPKEHEPADIHYVGELALDLDEELIIPNSEIDTADIASRKKEMDERRRNTPRVNHSGRYLYALTKFSPDDSILHEYINAKVFGSNISPNLLASVLLSPATDFEDPFIKRIIVTELYYGIMLWDIERKEKNLRENKHYSQPR